MNYSNEEESYKQSSGRVVIGKWRNNGEAFEPKWRDGDSVPLAPFSTMSFNSGWKRKGPDSREDYQIEPDSFYTGSIAKNGDFHEGESRAVIENENEKKNYNGEKFVHETQRYKNVNPNREDKAKENPSERRNDSGVKHRETLQSYPNEYEMFENENDDPRPRKRRPPQNYEFTTTSEKGTEIEPRKHENVELKTFLKMQGNDLSLSEILQQKNLTLADILRGKPNAIRILKSNDNPAPDVKTSAISITETPVKITLNSSTSGYLRWSPSRKITDKIVPDGDNESTTPSMNTKTEENASSIMKDQEENKSVDSEHEFLKPLEENRESLVIDATSNDRNAPAVSSEVKLTDNNDDDEIMEFSDYPLKMSKFIPPVIYDTMRKNVPYSAIRASSNPVEDTDSKLSIENILSTVKTVANVNKSVNVVNPSPKVDDESLRNSDKVVVNYSTTLNPKDSESDSKINDKNSTLNQKFHEVVIPKIDPQSRAEIMELFSSGSSAERLERLLASRNMTIEELIALRQRGSSQVHFAEVFKSKELQNSKVDDKKNETKFDNSTILKNTRKETFGKYLATDLFDQLSKNVNSRPDKTIRKFEKEDKTTIAEILPDVNNIQRDSEGSSYYTSIETVKVVPAVEEEEVVKIPGIFDERKKPPLLGENFAEIGIVEEIINNDLKSLKTNDYEYSDKKSHQSNNKVKPSIIASGGILGVTIVVFLAIFIACRIRQKKKFTYKNSFAKAVFHNPVMTPRKLSNTSSVNTIMVDVVATSTTKRHQNHDPYQNDDFDIEKSDIDNDSLDANDSWDTIPDFMK